MEFILYRMVDVIWGCIIICLFSGRDMGISFYRLFIIYFCFGKFVEKYNCFLKNFLVKYYYNK